MIAFFTTFAMFTAEGTNFRFIGKAVVDFRNDSDQAITVIMNNNESFTIEAHGQVTFTKANIGDTPSFYIKDSKGTVIFAKQVEMLGAKATFGWNGSKF
jgi:hypothetical protein